MQPATLLERHRRVENPRRRADDIAQMLPGDAAAAATACTDPTVTRLLFDRTDHVELKLACASSGLIDRDRLATITDEVVALNDSSTRAYEIIRNADIDIALELLVRRADTEPSPETVSLFAYTFQRAHVSERADVIAAAQKLDELASVQVRDRLRRSLSSDPLATGALTADALGWLLLAPADEPDDEPGLYDDLPELERDVRLAGHLLARIDADAFDTIVNRHQPNADGAGIVMAALDELHAHEQRDGTRAGTLVSLQHAAATIAAAARPATGPVRRALVEAVLRGRAALGRELFALITELDTAGQIDAALASDTPQPGHQPVHDTDGHQPLARRFDDEALLVAAGARHLPIAYRATLLRDPRLTDETCRRLLLATLASDTPEVLVAHLDVIGGAAIDALSGGDLKLVMSRASYRIGRELAGSDHHGIRGPDGHLQPGSGPWSPGSPAYGAFSALVRLFGRDIQSRTVLIGQLTPDVSDPGYRQASVTHGSAYAHIFRTQRRAIASHPDIASILHQAALADPDEPDSAHLRPIAFLEMVRLGAPVPEAFIPSLLWELDDDELGHVLRSHITPDPLSPAATLRTPVAARRLTTRASRKEFPGWRTVTLEDIETHATCRPGIVADAVERAFSGTLLGSWFDGIGANLHVSDTSSMLAAWFDGYVERQLIGVASDDAGAHDANALDVGSRSPGAREAQTRDAGAGDAVRHTPDPPADETHEIVDVWREMLALADTFDGTFGELLQTGCALAGLQHLPGTHAHDQPAHGAAGRSSQQLGLVTAAGAGS